ncbi:sigma-70 family RNA polymerase sigma factor [Micromonospora sp. ALFpr18c]|uniref:RNA polymerase sigma factor n=1 Tax=unclassified Micromonospora TaxID=2617518 RepID=UPI001788D144|nr:sigma-70 family RNA polymerase sigma factor [Micromonospora sp. ALFpr18c]
MANTDQHCADAGRTQSLNELMSDHAESLFTYVRALVRDHHLAEDIVQETFLRAWRHTHRLPCGGSPLRDWLTSVARDLAVTSLRECAAQRESIEPEFDVSQPDHADAAVATAEAITLLRRLPEEHRAVLLHTYLAGRTTHQTARALGVPVRTVRSWHRWALSTLRASCRTP